MALGAMQPYLFPYLGYFQLMNCVETYVFCGDVQYIKHGWVNRNRIITNVSKNECHYFSFSVAGDSYKKNINQRYYSNLKSDCDKLKRNLFQSYRTAVNFEEAYAVLDEIMQFPNCNVAFFNMNANYKIAQYLGIRTKITCTDCIEDKGFWEKFYQSDRESRMIHMCRYFGEKRYINAVNGTSLYHKNTFKDEGIDLGFIKMDEIIYPQFKGPFVPDLSIIDVIMHNKVPEVRKMLDRFQIL